MFDSYISKTCLTVAPLPGIPSDSSQIAQLVIRHSYYGQGIRLYKMGRCRAKRKQNWDEPIGSENVGRSCLCQKEDGGGIEIGCDGDIKSRRDRRIREVGNLERGDTLV